MKQAYSHPEIEFRPEISGNEFVNDVPSSTLLDLLEIYPRRIVWKPQLSHSRLMRYFRDQGVLNNEQPQTLRIFFLKLPNHDDSTRVDDNSSLEVNPTASWMRQKFGVTPLFFNSLSSLIVGNATFLRRENARPISLDGLYRISYGMNHPIVTVWFSHSLGKDKISAYIIHRCHDETKKNIITYAQDNTSTMLLRPLVIDAFLAEHCLNALSGNVERLRHSLLTYEQAAIAHFTSLQVAEAVEELHTVSQMLHIVREHLTDMHTRLQYLMKVYRRLMAIPGPSEDLDSVLESFEYLSSKADIMRRWAVTYNERAGIQINLFFNIATQTDSRTNLEIARLSSKIAVSTQLDSSSMITMAAVTMFFLPGTFVSALFSMVFFTTDTSSKVAVGRQWWIFPAVTIPLTILVFAIWVLWQRYRNKAALGISTLPNVPEMD